ncbi:hypothetical protein AG0111_0g7943 [Alternaria gaisen]|uniref:Uncharacterized protein n=1 Tax=Alternaria gaisen TaxID=167740 RepID=A0ACB6FHI9_9PLEO|nr:hypothetical protein AG0111_0g7943 [Alternaria gaisen]
MKSFTLVSFAASLGLVNAQAALCNGAFRPSYEDCDETVKFFNLEGSTHITHTNGALNPAPSCYNWWWDGGNCLITHCFQESGTDDPNNPRTITDGQVHQLYTRVRDRCMPFLSGGKFTGALEFLEVTNDEGGDGPPSKRAMKRAEFPGLNVESFANGMNRGHSSLEDYLEWRNDTMSGIDTAGIAKRQSEDDSWDVSFRALNVRNPDVFTLGLRLDSKVGYSYEVSESQTYSVTTSVSMGGAIEAFSASVGVEVSQSETFTVTEGITFDVDCPKQGQITFWPLYNYYEVKGHPSEKEYEIWLPVLTPDRKINGEIAVSCLG